MLFPCCHHGGRLRSVVPCPVRRRYCNNNKVGSDTTAFRRALSTNNNKKTGAGFGNVHDPMLPSDRYKELFRHCKSPKTVSIIGAPMTYGQPFVGTDDGPSRLREAGLRSMLSSLGWRVEDSPDLRFEELAANSTATIPAAKNCGIIGKASELLADMVQTKVEEGNFPLILGGDHSIGIGSLTGLLRARPNIGVLWIDAHADLNTPATSGSGNMHGMPIGFVMDGIMSPEEKARIPGFEWMANKPELPLLPSDSIVYVGLRDVDVPERGFIRQRNIRAFTMHDIDRYGIGNVMEMALHHLLKDDPHRPLHISYDIDAVDPVLAPATGTTVRGGLTFREAHYVAEAAAESGNLASAEIVELNPYLADGEGAKETVELGLQIVTSLMGKGII